MYEFERIAVLRKVQDRLGLAKKKGLSPSVARIVRAVIREVTGVRNPYDLADMTSQVCVEFGKRGAKAHLAQTRREAAAAQHMPYADAYGA